MDDEESSGRKRRGVRTRIVNEEVGDILGSAVPGDRQGMTSIGSSDEQREGLGREGR